MKRKIIYTLIISLLALTSALAQDKPLGAGIIIGEPTGLCLKYWITGESAADLAVGWHFSGDDYFHLHADYLLHNFSLIKVPEGKLPLYYGVGGRYVKREKDNKAKDDEKEDILGVRVPVGLSYIFSGISLDIFLEIVPVVNLIPDTDFDLDLALGVRYFF